jgi:hypothetical protein
VPAKATAEDAREQLEIVSSLGRSDAIFAYHLGHARDAFKGLIHEEEPTGGKNFELVLGVSDRQEEASIAYVASEAHMLGCMHTVRGWGDLLASLVNRLLLANAIEEWKCDIHTVRDKLDPSDLKEKLQALTDGAAFKYVSDFVNTVKHRRLIRNGININFADNKIGTVVGAFRKHPERWGTDVLQDAIAVQHALVRCGIALNRHCGLT